MILKGLDHHFLYASTVYADRRATEIQTVLGSCVSVCLYDQKLNFGGMNHYMLPLWDGEGLATAKYGNIAIEKLLERMFALGATRKNLIAKVFGGADQLGENGYFSIGKRNMLLAQDTLTDLHIPIVASNVGGSVGRKVLFNSESGQVLMKFVKN